MAHGLLKGKRGIISGALNEQSIAWKVAELAHAEGAEIVLTNAPVAMRMGEINQLASEINALRMPPVMRILKSSLRIHRRNLVAQWTLCYIALA